MIALVLSVPDSGGPGPNAERSPWALACARGSESPQEDPPHLPAPGPAPSTGCRRHPKTWRQRALRAWPCRRPAARAQCPCEETRSNAAAASHGPPASNCWRRPVLSPWKQLRFAHFRGGGGGLVAPSDLAELMHLPEWAQGLNLSPGSGSPGLAVACRWHLVGRCGQCLPGQSTPEVTHGVPSDSAPKWDTRDRGELEMKPGGHLSCSATAAVAGQLQVSPHPGGRHPSQSAFTDSALCRAASGTNGLWRVRPQAAAAWSAGASVCTKLRRTR